MNRLFDDLNHTHPRGARPLAASAGSGTAARHCRVACECRATEWYPPFLVWATVRKQHRSMAAEFVRHEVKFGGGHCRPRASGQCSFGQCGARSPGVELSTPEPSCPPPPRPKFRFKSQKSDSKERFESFFSIIIVRFKSVYDFNSRSKSLT